jgi:hypothetical protein
MSDRRPRTWPCSFCGLSTDEDVIELSVGWGDGIWQAWDVHPSCLAAQFTQDIRDTGGPFFGDDED